MLFRSMIIFMAYLIPVALVIWFISKFSVDVPFNDQWALVPLFDKVNKGSVTFGDFFAPHNEHRIFFPKVIFVLLAFASKWNLDLERYFSVFLAIVTFLLMYKIAEISYSQDKLSFHLFNILTCFLLFSLSQAGSWLFGFQLVTEPAKIYGQIEQPTATDQPITSSRRGSIKVVGSATLPERQQPPELVLLSHDNERSFFANATIIKLDRYDNKIQWESEIFPQSFSQGETTIKAWIYDREGKQFIKLDGQVKVRI